MARAGAAGGGPAGGCRTAVAAQQLLYGVQDPVSYTVRQFLYDVQVDFPEPDRPRRRDPTGDPAVRFSTLT
ncbi:hypothetical protein GCM10010253_26680 [Streptomyces badius]|uniref:Uncharacterized protein n=1 Tax=Streptomyces badius TaxID=1941 RepID=A0ABQ2T3T0_STRBA|nr:hypothetical protein GCM10010253_26680 [Streptomyces badius]